MRIEEEKVRLPGINYNYNQQRPDKSPPIAHANPVVENSLNFKNYQGQSSQYFDKIITKIKNNKMILSVALVLVVVFTLIYFSASGSVPHESPQSNELTIPKNSQPEHKLKCSDVEAYGTPIENSQIYLKTVKDWKDFTTYAKNNEFYSFYFFKHCKYALGNTQTSTEIWETSPKLYVKTIKNKCLNFVSSPQQDFFLCTQNNGIIQYLNNDPAFNMKVLTQEENSDIDKILISSDSRFVVFSFTIGNYQGLKYKEISFTGKKKQTVPVNGKLKSFSLGIGKINYEDDSGRKTFILG